MNEFKTWMCVTCGWIYDEELGAPPWKGNLPGMGGQMCRALRQQHHGLLAQHDGQQHGCMGWLAVHELLLQHHLRLPLGRLRKTRAQGIGRLRRQGHGRQVRIHPDHRHHAGIKVGQGRQRRDDR